ncbi:MULTISPECIES: DNA-binding protein [Oscillibacter]|uniref:DNA-binding protein n=1 Tax=Oscillibacter TaxID=459786 RepID=UPI0028A0385F|nr:DNA-binding protein [Oscillibacter sp.]
MNSVNTIPRMRSIMEVSSETGIPYHTIRQWCLEKRIVHIKAGNKYLVNLDRFIDFLNTGDANGGRPNAV